MRCLLCFLLFISSPALAQLNADFSAVSTQGCSPLTVQFQDKSTGSPSEWFWDFGNGVTSSLQNPAITYTNYGNYTVRLIIRNSLGEALAEKNSYIKVFPTPRAIFSITNSSGCAPLLATFQDTSELFGDALKSRLWTFGDGNTSNQQNPTNTFNSGRFNISLAIETQHGCVDTSIKVNAVTAGNKPVAQFNAVPLTGCASKARQFINQSTGNITDSKWTFGDGGFSSDKHPLYSFQDSGKFDVKLVVSDNGCKDSIIKPGYISVQAPAGKLVTSFDCNNRSTITFTDRTKGASTRLWDFGDGQTSTDIKAVHTYTSPGTYVVKLSVTGTSCDDTERDTVYIKPPLPQVVVSPADSLHCKNRPLQFAVTGFDSAVSKYFAWNFKDGVVTPLRSTTATISHTYRQAGVYQPYVDIQDYARCHDTIPIVNPINIYGPTALFDSVGIGCSNQGISFTDKSTPYQNAPITQWFWNFGDGLTSAAKDTNYLYSFAGTYNVKLRVTDSNGCSDSMINPINVFITPTVDAGNDTLVCAGSKITLNPTGASTYTWQSNPDLSCTSCTNPVAKPHQPAVYHVTGTSDGCSASDSIVVDAQIKEKVTVQPDNYSVCQGNSVTLSASGADIYSWAPTSSLNNSTINNPVATPSTNTVYSVIGKDSHNCFADTAYANVTVNRLPTVNIADSMVQLMTGTSFTILATTSNDVGTLKWTPGTDLSCTDCLQPVATVNNSINYTLNATNEFGCSSKDSISIIAVCTDQFIYVPNTFSPNNDGMNDYFFPRSGSGISIKSLTIFNRWGQMVFQKKDFPANNFNAGWDGRYKNVPQAADAYVYMMELNCSGNKVFVKKGTITLLR